MTRRRIIGGGVIALAATVAAIIAGTYLPTILSAGRRVQWDEPGFAQSGTTRCVAFDARVTGRCLRKAGFTVADEVLDETVYTVIRLCGEPAPDDSIDWSSVPDCIEPVARDRVQAVDEPPDGSVHTFEAVIPPLAYQAGFACACKVAGSDAGCEARAPDGGWVPCRPAWTYDPGRSRGLGRVPTPCAVAFGHAGMNPLCEVGP